MVLRRSSPLFWHLLPSEGAQGRSKGVCRGLLFLLRQNTYRGLFSVLLLFLLAALCLPGADAGFLNTFSNCLETGIIFSDDPKLLQFEVAAVFASFNPNGSSYPLNITIYGNVSGQATAGSYPPPFDPQWASNDTFGKIPDQDPATGLQTTMYTRYNVLGYTPYKSPPMRFCNYTLNTHCPVGPVFDSNINATSLPAVSVTHDMGSSYGFTTINPVFRIVNNDKQATHIMCLSAEVTPYLGQTTTGLLAYLPLAILILVGITTASAAIFSPWGTSDVFRWTSNYGRDADQLRLITPGFGDCLQYIQFVVLSGSLSLRYPGFYQPAVSSVAWSTLMFPENFVSRNATADGPYPVGVVDGIYVTNNPYGLGSLSELVGMANDRNIWAGMIIWLLVIIAAVVLLIQAGFACRWIYRQVSNTREEDLRRKNWPFTCGNAIRIIFNYFLLPLVTFSMYELVIANKIVTEGSNVVPVAFAAITMIALLIFIGWLFLLITRTQPRSYLFDDLQTVLLYGSLYNTYSDQVAAFAVVPILLTVLRGIAIGAVQPSGVAQLVLLAICEVVLILTLNAFRPFSSPTSMNAYHTIFSVVRLLSVLLMVAFVPSLEVDQSPRGWIGYVILLMHGITLFVGFFLHSLQTLIEVIARLAGAGGEDGAAMRGGLVKVFGVRQLSRRHPRNTQEARVSMGSDAAMLNVNGEHRDPHGGRSRSASASSAQLLKSSHNHRVSMGLESSAGGGASHAGSAAGGPHTPTSMDGAVQGSAAGQRAMRPNSTGNGGPDMRNNEAGDLFFRQPRPRRTTLEFAPPGGKTPVSRSSVDWTKGNSPEAGDAFESQSISGRGTPQPAYLGGLRERSDSNAEDPTRPKPDYATREVDFYYGVRGPALSHMPTRRLKTGPGDPTGPVSSATGWFKNFLGGKTKEKGKGFEVVRSSRMPPQEQNPDETDIALEDQGPYHDDPEAVAAGIPKTTSRPRNLELDDEGDAVGGGTRRIPSDAEEGAEARSPQDAPTLPDIDTGGSINIPSRFASKASSRPSRNNTQRGEALSPAEEFIPPVPRRSSKRTSSHGSASDFDTSRNASRLSIIPASPSSHKSSSIALRSDWSGGAGSPPAFPAGVVSRAPHLSSPSPGASQRLPFSVAGATGGGLAPVARPGHHMRSQSYGSAISGISAVSSSALGDEPPPSTSDLDGGPSGGSAHARRSSGALGNYAHAHAQPQHARVQPAYRGGVPDERPGSIGYVQQHRASDQIHVVEPDADSPVLLSGSKAELVDDGAAGGIGRAK